MFYTLIADPDNVTAASLAQRWGVTRQTVHNYRHDRGLPVRRVTSGGMVYFSLREAERWRAEHMPDLVPGRADPSARAAGAGLVTNGRGGRRPGAGRKPADPGAGTGLLADAAEDDKTTPAEDVRALLGSIHGPDDVLRLLREGRMTRSLAQTVLEAWKAIELQTRLQRERGELVSAAAAEQEWTRALQQIRGELDNLPGTAAQRLLAAGLLRPDQEAAARATLEAEIDRVVGVLGQTKTNAEDANRESRIANGSDPAAPAPDSRLPIRDSRSATPDA